MWIPTWIDEIMFRRTDIKKFLFRSRQRPSDSMKDERLKLEFVSQMVRIPSRKFFGEFARSANGQHLLAWRDADPTGRRAGFRENGEGDYLLVHDGSVIVEGRMERPNDGQVADTGTFILSDWRFGDQLQSTFYAFDRQGRTLISHEFGANALNSGISLDGRFANYMTAGGDHPDSNKLALFDLETKELLWSRRPESGRPDRYEFEPSEALLRLIYEGKGRYAYSMSDGDFLDHERWETERVEWAHPYELPRIGRDRLKAAGDALDLQTGAEIAFILKKAISTGIEQSPSEHAKVLKALGELWGMLGDDREALTYYEQADTTYPKVGVKRRIMSVKKRLGGSEGAD